MRCGVLGRARSGKCYEVRTTRRFGPVVIIKAANDEIEPIVEQSAENLEFICQIAALGIRCGGKQREGNANPRRDGKEQRPINTGVDRQTGRASCREKVCQYVWISGVRDALKKKQNTIKEK